MAQAQGESSHNQAMETTENDISQSDEAEQDMQMQYVRWGYIQGRKFKAWLIQAVFYERRELFAFT